MVSKVMNASLINVTDTYKVAKDSYGVGMTNSFTSSDDWAKFIVILTSSRLIEKPVDNGVTAGN